MRRFIPAGFETRNGVLIALLGLCLRSRHIAEGRRHCRLLQVFWRVKEVVIILDSECSKQDEYVLFLIFSKITNNENS